MKVEVIDNFLSPYYFNTLQSEVMGENFTWFYNSYTTDPGDGNNQFTSAFYMNELPYKHFPLIEPCLVKLNIVSQQLARIKANMKMQTVFHRGCGYHSDYPDMNTAIFYINTNKGYTKFKKGGKVKSIANRMVIFDSNLEHQGFTCTNEKRRIVLNFNWK